MQQAFALCVLSVLMACSTPSTSNQETKTTTTMETTASSSLYDIPLQTIDGKPASLAQYKGKKILIVNVASECGYTPQYADLEKLHQQHGGKVVVLGFPANDFGGQEPGSNEQIAQFCQRNFGVTFPLFQKAAVTGAEQQPLFQWLTSQEQNGSNSEAPNWNFCKYLISEDGKVLKFYPSKVSPVSEELLRDINS
jgi:glutathione peroxidase